MLSQIVLKELIDYVQGEGELSSTSLLELKKIGTKKALIVYRGLSFESQEEFNQLYGIENFITYVAKSGESFSLSFDSASLFAQDIYSNYGVVLEISLETLSLNLLELPETIKEQLKDFDHEQEIISLEQFQTKAKIVKVYKNTKNILGLK